MKPVDAVTTVEKEKPYQAHADDKHRRSAIEGATIEVAELPSQHKAYMPGAHVYYRPYTYRELDDFNDSTVSDGEGIRFVLSGMSARNMDPLDLTLGDFLYIGLLRKISSLGSTQFTVTITEFKGKILDESIKRKFNFDDIGFETLEIPALPIKATLSFGVHEFQPLRIRQYLNLLDLGLHNNERALMAAQMVSEPDFDAAYDAINNCMGRDLVILNKIDQLLDHGVMPLEVKFNHNGEEVVKRVDISDPHSLVWPFCEHDELAGGAIRFGV